MTHSLARTGHGPTRFPFTLIELLVVVSIISVLAAILLPSLTRAKQLAVRTSCMSQQKQAVISTFGYTDDNGGWFPMYEHARLMNTPNINQWVNQYIPEPKKILRCPGHQTISYASKAYDPVWVASNFVTMSYQVGAGTGSYPAPTTANVFFGFQGISTSTTAYPRAICPNVNMVGTTQLTTVSSAGAQYKHYVATADVQPALMDGHTPFALQWSNGGSAYYEINHRGGENIVFVDGHGEWRADAEMRARYRSLYW